MHLSPLEEYAIRCALQLARLSDSEHVAASKIAHLEGISIEYVSKIMFLFRQGLLVESVRGVQGGFKLQRSPEKITLKEVFDLLPTSRPFGDEFCQQYTGLEESCVHLESCSIRPVWGIFSRYFEDLSSSITLSDLLVRENVVKKKVQGIAMEKVKAIKKEVAK